MQGLRLSRHMLILHFSTFWDFLNVNVPQCSCTNWLSRVGFMATTGVFAHPHHQ